MSGRSNDRSIFATDWWPWQPRTPFFSLLQLQRRAGWRRMLEQMGGSGGTKRSYVILALVAIGVIPALAMFFGIAWMMQATYISLGQPHAILTLMFVASQVICLVFGIGYIVSAFYFDTESKLLAPLPLQPELIAAARFWRVLGGEYATLGLFLTPFFLAYVFQVQPGLAFWLGIIPVFLLLPVAPLAISGALAVLFMHLTAGRASRDAVRAIGIALIVLLSVGFSMFIQSGASRGSPEQFLDAVTSGRLQLVDEIGRWLPTSVWATKTVMGGPGALLSFLLYVLAAAGAFAVLLWLSRRFLMAALLDPETGKGKRRTVTRDDLARDLSRNRSPLAACIWREVVLLWRQPLFLMNALVGNLMLPILITLPMLFNRDVSDLFGSIAHSETVRNGFLYGALGLLTFSASASGLGSTAISREGRLFWLSRALPVAPRVQVLAKLYWSTAWGLLGAVVVAAGGIGLFRFNTTEALLTLIGGLLIAWIVNGLGLMVDLTRPNLTWTDPQQAMKGNWNALLAMLLMLIVAAVVVVAAVLLALLGLPSLVIVFALLIVGSGLIWWGLGPMAERQYATLAG